MASRPAARRRWSRPSAPAAGGKLTAKVRPKARHDVHRRVRGRRRLQGRAERRRRGEGAGRAEDQGHRRRAAARAARGCSATRSGAGRSTCCAPRSASRCRRRWRPDGEVHHAAASRQEAGAPSAGRASRPTRRAGREPSGSTAALVDRPQAARPRHVGRLVGAGPGNGANGDVQDRPLTDRRLPACAVLSRGSDPKWRFSGVRPRARDCHGSRADRAICAVRACSGPETMRLL